MQNLTTDNLMVVLDLGTSKIRGVVGRKNEFGQVEIIAYEELTFPKNSLGTKRGSIFNLTETAFCIKDLLTKLQNNVNLIFNEDCPEEERKAFEISGVYVGLNGQTIKTIDNRIRRILGGVEITGEMVEALQAENNNLQIENGEILEIIAQEHLVDDSDVVNPVGCTCTQQLEGRYKIIAARPSLRSNLIKCFEKVNDSIERTGSSCKVEILGMFLSPVAAASAVLSPEEKQLGCAMIDFGAGTTSIAVYYKNILRHVSVIPFGSDTITRDITDLKMLDDMAERLKVRCGSAMESLAEKYEIVLKSSIPGKEGKTICNKFLAGVIEARVDEILDYVCYQIEKTEYYHCLDEVVITGGGARLKNLDEKLKSRIGLDVRIGVPNQKKSPDMAECFLNVECAQLVGLLIHAEKACVREKMAVVSKDEEEEEKEKGKTSPSKRPARSLKDRLGTLFGKIDEIFEDQKFENEQ